MSEHAHIHTHTHTPGRRTPTSCREWGGVSLGRVGNKIRNQTVSVFPGGSDGKESACSAGDPSLIPVLGRFPGDGKGYPLQYSCLKNSLEFSWAIVHEVTKSQTQLSTYTFSHFLARKAAAIWEEMRSSASNSGSHLAAGWNHLKVLKSVDFCMPSPEILT